MQQPVGGAHFVKCQRARAADRVLDVYFWVEPHEYQDDQHHQDHASQHNWRVYQRYSNFKPALCPESHWNDDKKHCDEYKVPVSVHEQIVVVLHDEEYDDCDIHRCPSDTSKRKKVRPPEPPQISA